MPAHQRQPTATALRSGAATVLGRIASSSNLIFLVELGPTPAPSEPLAPAAPATTVGETNGEQGSEPLLAVYKPVAGERPLWDFPPGICRREVAAYVLSQRLGWPQIPCTVMRDDAPFGPGSFQLLIDADPSQHYFSLMERTELHDQLRSIAAFDILTNNTDRKSGHCLLGHRTNHVYAIDNALCFHVDPKLRTVIWDFAGETLPATMLADIERAIRSPTDDLAALLEPEELDALVARGEAMLTGAPLPFPAGPQSYPWPLR